MDFSNILTKLNEKTGNEFGFVLGKANLHESVYDLEFRYKDGTILGPEKRNELQIFILNNLPAGFIYNIKFVKNIKTEEVVLAQVKELISKNFPALIYKLHDFNNETNCLNLEVDSDAFYYAQSKDIKGFLEKELEKIYLAKFEVKLAEFETKIEEKLDDFVFEEAEVKNEILVKDVMPFCGEKILTKPIAIKAITHVAPRVTICGKIKYIISRVYKSKKEREKDNNLNKSESEQEAFKTEQAESIDPNEQASENYEKKLFKFAVEDYSGTLNCIYFSTKQTFSNAEKLQEGSSVVVFGDCIEDSFSGGITLKAKQINLCTLPENFKEEIVFKPEPENYTWCFPEPYVDKKQVDLFSVLAGESETPEYLKTHDVVVFDFETTGLSATDCKIIEIGAVKVHNGKISEVFETFVNPEEHIDDDSTLVHGITDDMVARAPNYQKALQDFYKFTRNSTLVAYNIAFDYSFLDLYGKKAGYNFNNPQIDAMKLATNFVKGVKNYKLKTVAERLGVVLDNAHRAVFDTIATAEVFIKLADHISADLIKNGND